MSAVENSFLELIKVTSTVLPKDVVASLTKFAALEKEGTPAKYAMDQIVKNINLACDKEQALCQDTGSILFFVRTPKNFDEGRFIIDAKAAVVHATKIGYLRQNSVDSLTGKNTGDNLGPGSPHFHFEQGTKDFIDVRLILKGGGCENVGAQYSLPNEELGAFRNLEGAKKCVLDAVFKAQGKGCAPAVLGVTIGGDRTTGYIHSKEQFLRKVDDKNSNPVLAALEDEIVAKANGSGIGPMGFGGKTTVFGCKIGTLNRIPASFFVTISYMCWAYRRQGVLMDQKGGIKEWLY